MLKDVHLELKKIILAFKTIVGETVELIVCTLEIHLHHVENDGASKIHSRPSRTCS